MRQPVRDRDICVPLTKSLFKSAGITVSHFFSMLPSALKYLYSVEPVRMHFPRKTAVYKLYCVQCCIAALHTVSFVHGCFAGKMHSDRFNKIEILQGRWQHGEKGGTVIPVDLKRLFLSGTYMSRWLRKG